MEAVGSKYLPLSARERSELKFWVSWVKGPTSRPFAHSPGVDDFIIEIDASSVALGAVLRGPKGLEEKGARNLDESQIPLSSTHRELLAIEFGLKAFLSHVSGSSVRIFCDNQAAVLIARCGCAKDTLHEIAVEIHETARKARITLELTWIPRDMNVEADPASRWIDGDDWGIKEQTFRECAEIDSKGIDAFALPGFWQSARLSWGERPLDQLNLPSSHFCWEIGSGRPLDAYRASRSSLAVAKASFLFFGGNPISEEVPEDLSRALVRCAAFPRRSPSHLRAICEHLDRSDASRDEVRMGAFVVLSMDALLRVSEATALLWEDVTEEESPDSPSLSSSRRPRTIKRGRERPPLFVSLDRLPLSTSGSVSSLSLPRPLPPYQFSTRSPPINLSPLPSSIPLSIPCVIFSLSLVSVPILFVSQESPHQLDKVPLSTRFVREGDGSHWRAFPLILAIPRNSKEEASFSRVSLPLTPLPSSTLSRSPVFPPLIRCPTCSRPSHRFLPIPISRNTVSIMYKCGKNDWYLSGLNSQKFFATTKTQPLYHRGTLLLSLRDHENETKLFGLIGPTERDRPFSTVRVRPDHSLSTSSTRNYEKIIIKFDVTAPGANDDST
uniref:RT_RNaseH domain-containing protein n=1 Tax=Pristionchus pacificus TaxID=54126 RepID=A0A8R1YT63_PRIPA